MVKNLKVIQWTFGWILSAERNTWAERENKERKSTEKEYPGNLPNQERKHPQRKPQRTTKKQSKLHKKICSLDITEWLWIQRFSYRKQLKQLTVIFLFWLVVTPEVKNCHGDDNFSKCSWKLPFWSTIKQFVISEKSLLHSKNIQRIWLSHVKISFKKHSKNLVESCKDLSRWNRQTSQEAFNKHFQKGLKMRSHCQQSAETRSQSFSVRVGDVRRHEWQKSLGRANVELLNLQMSCNTIQQLPMGAELKWLTPWYSCVLYSSRNTYLCPTEKQLGHLHLLHHCQCERTFLSFWSVEHFEYVEYRLSSVWKCPDFLRLQVGYR